MKAVKIVYAWAALHTVQYVVAIVAGDFPLFDKIAALVWAVGTLAIVLNWITPKAHPLELRLSGMLGILSFMPKEKRIAYVREALTQQARRVVESQKRMQETDLADGEWDKAKRAVGLEQYNFDLVRFAAYGIIQQFNDHDLKPFLQMDADQLA